ncbi:NUDIX domain-containing protein [Liquorilactobacillus satsumensis]|nr:NUDIX domain-containing protein [Liquorilactobacillus satsumensis]MCC7666848.1 NUDIX domain-containing protein [Liquorilactobacillus satsumensis]MCP9313571.1 NUDIX domain-containing protein [Liquorilactobacillus satsumensis]MCP9328626.1 NUDIX domain-containing protein [Liquorilactobacillus satsumensis]MCP9356948.1 NUDIX domain-containing protein [Liquorilactobacillus satsumensis]MCP9360712.1 NUDIX domain-containing protein [Liquorilactobacillus satsumensis]
MDKNYIARMREKVGHEGMIFVSAYGVLWNEAHDAILLEKRWDSEVGWGFPGGYLEYGDSPTQAVIREFKEETNLDVEVTRVLGISTNITQKNSWGDAQETIGVGFEVRKVGGVLRKDGTETLDLQFVPVNPEPKMFVPQAQKTMHRILTENETSAQPWLREPGD